MPTATVSHQTVEDILRTKGYEPAPDDVSLLVTYLTERRLLKYADDDLVVWSVAQQILPQLTDDQPPREVADKQPGGSVAPDQVFEWIEARVGEIVDAHVAELHRELIDWVLAEAQHSFFALHPDQTVNHFLKTEVSPFAPPIHKLRDDIAYAGEDYLRLLDYFLDFAYGRLVDMAFIAIEAAPPEISDYLSRTGEDGVPVVDSSKFKHALEDRLTGCHDICDKMILCLFDVTLGQAAENSNPALHERLKCDASDSVFVPEIADEMRGKIQKVFGDAPIDIRYTHQILNTLASLIQDDLSVYAFVQVLNDIEMTPAYASRRLRRLTREFLSPMRGVSGMFQHPLLKVFYAASIARDTSPNGWELFLSIASDEEGEDITFWVQDEDWAAFVPFVFNHLYYEHGRAIGITIRHTVQSTTAERPETSVAGVIIEDDQSIKLLSATKSRECYHFDGAMTAGQAEPDLRFVDAWTLLPELDGEPVGINTLLQ